MSLNDFATETDIQLNHLTSAGERTRRATPWAEAFELLRAALANKVRADALTFAEDIAFGLARIPYRARQKLLADVAVFTYEAAHFSQPIIDRVDLVNAFIDRAGHS